jgi:hypothetical protein
MANKSGPRVSSDSLILYIDAANYRSYSGTGITVDNLIPRPSLTLINGVTYSNLNQGYFTFDGTNDNLPFSLSSIGNTLSIIMWARIKAFSGGMFLGFNLHSIWTGGGRLGFNTAVSDVYGMTSTQVTNAALLNQWKQYVFEMRSDVSYSNNKIYIDSQIQSLSQVTGTESAANRNFNSGNGRIASWLANDNFFMSMDLAQFSVYSKSLSQNEITQNYNSIKKRFSK